MAYVVITRYLPPTDEKGARIMAGLSGRERRGITVPYDGAEDPARAHAAAAIKLIRRLRIGGTWAAGTIPSGYVWIRTDCWDTPCEEGRATQITGAAGRDT